MESLCLIRLSRVNHGRETGYAVALIGQLLDGSVFHHNDQNNFASNVLEIFSVFK
jgi:hypothetical protein